MRRCALSEIWWVNRRQLVIDAACLGALSAMLPMARAAALEPEKEGPGLAAWVRVGREGGARIALATPTCAADRDVAWSHLRGVTLDLASSGWRQRQQACAAARGLLAGVAATRWGLSRDDCRVEANEVLHVPSGRRVPYTIWVDIT